MKILVTGATGYIGGRLVPLLLERGHELRVLVRDSRRVESRSWADAVEIVSGDLLDRTTLDQAGEGIDAAFYLVHSMGAGGDFEERDRRAASNFIEALPPECRVIYLGGLLPDETASAHLKSRGEVGEILRSSRPTLEFRAGPIIGSGSASFEMVRYLTERLPIMIAPKWIRNPVQPIAIDDVLRYLLEGVESNETGVVDIGANRLSFREMMTEYAAERGLWRLIIPVPLLAPRLAARWVGLVTPISNRIAVPLIGGIVSTPVADTRRARELFPDVRTVPYRQAVSRAIEEADQGETTTSWSGALGSGPAYETEDREGLIQEHRVLDVDAAPERVYRTLTGLGGSRGWLVWPLAWRIRGTIDKLLGGPGLRRGRRHPRELHTGEALDFWRVEAADEPSLLRLRAEMKVPGRAWLEWKIEPGDSGARLTQTATFAPRGLPGVIYWYLLYPIHGLVFNDMLAAIRDLAESNDPL